MAEGVEYVTGPALEQQELPAWVAVWALMVDNLRKAGVWKVAAEEIRLEREQGYVFEDLLGLLVAFFCWRRHAGGRRGIKRFCREMEHHHWGPGLAAILGRDSWPTSGSVSRMLAAVKRPMGALFRQRVLGQVVAFSKLPVNWSTVFHDSQGEWFVVFDLDGIVKALRRRALPANADLPEAQRGASAMGAPGYSGRKRSDVQVSSERLQHAGSGQWLGQDSSPGNTAMGPALEQAVAWLVDFCTAVGLPRQRVVLRVDGAAGHAGCLQHVRAAGLRVLVRWVHYEALDQPDVRTWLQQEVWYPVPSSESGPRRHAAEVGPCPCLPQQPAGAPPLRLVVSRFDCAQHGKKRGAGLVLGKAQYEMYATDLEVKALSAEDVVALYYARACHENSLARANEELGLRDTFSENLPGQDLAVQVGLLVWNLAIELGATLKGLPESLPWPATSRPARIACRLPWDVDAPAAQTQTLPTTSSCAEPVTPTASESSQPSGMDSLPAQPSTASPSGPSEPAAPEPSAVVSGVPSAENPSAQPSPSSTPNVSMSTALPQPESGVCAPMVAVAKQNATTRETVPAWVTNHAGWSWDADHGLVCPARLRMCLHKRKTLPHAQLWFFRAKASSCPSCPQRSGCTTSTQPGFRREAVLKVPLDMNAPGTTAHNGPTVSYAPESAMPSRPVHPVRTADTSTREPCAAQPVPWTPAPPTEPGPFAVRYPVLVPSQLRQGLHTACETVVVRVEVTRPTSTPKPVPHLALTRAAHQHRRHTWAERRAWNALPTGTQVRVTFLGGTAIRSLLDDDRPTTKVV